MPPISPMSWKLGSQKTPDWLRVISKACMIRSELCSRFSCESITPFGVPVEPLVYCRNASVLPSMSGRSQRSAQATSSSLSTFQIRFSRLGAVARRASKRSSTSRVVRATDALASEAMASIRSTDRFLRGG
jgi:hypothetical protein